MELICYLDQRILEMEKKLSCIEQCRTDEVSKPIKSRNQDILLILFKDEATYKFCLNELIHIRKEFYEK